MIEKQDPEEGQKLVQKLNKVMNTFPYRLFTGLQSLAITVY
jgi:hypothetical protein